MAELFSLFKKTRKSMKAIWEILHADMNLYMLKIHLSFFEGRKLGMARNIQKKILSCISILVACVQKLH